MDVFCSECSLLFSWRSSSRCVKRTSQVTHTKQCTISERAIYKSILKPCLLFPHCGEKLYNRGPLFVTVVSRVIASFALRTMLDLLLTSATLSSLFITRAEQSSVELEYQTDFCDVAENDNLLALSQLGESHDFQTC